MNTTMSPAQESIIKTIETHMLRFKVNPNSWYVGITNNIRKKLFEEIGVSEQNDNWIYITTENNDSAKEIKKQLLSNGLSNINVSEDEIGNIIFVYQKSIS